MSVAMSVAPILKWVGGKRQLIPVIEQLLPKEINTYYEPFVGGGALFFHLKPPTAVINDMNEELINLYQTVKDEVYMLIELLRTHKNEAEYFYELRHKDREAVFMEWNEVQRAARMLYLNKTCFNGLYRVNSSGQFNVPFGKYKNPKIINDEKLKAVSFFLKVNDVQIKNEDFEDVIKDSKKGDFIYFDPPYHPASKTANFTAYAKGGFCEGDQIRLKNSCIKLHERGVKFLLSNSDTLFIREIYRHDIFNITNVQALRSINCKGNGRGKVGEVLIKNY